MKNPSSKLFRLINGVVFALLIVSTGSQAAITTIYEDTFSGDSSTLNGATTTIGSGTWNANTFVNRDGSMVEANQGGAVVGVTLAINNIYTLSMDVALTGTAATTKYLMLGFVDQATVTGAGASNATGRFNNNTMNGYPLITLVTGASVIQGSELYNVVAASTPFTDFANVHNYKIVINTSGNGSTFTASYYVDGVAFGTNLLMDQAPLGSIGGVGFAARSGAGTVDNFKLTVEPVPEPGTALLSSIGVLALLRRRRE